jgi:hypothetical protein
MPTAVTIYRNGNTTTPRLDNVRPIDVETYDLHGVEWVRARVRGISCFDATAGIHGKNWWDLPANSAIEPGLHLANDNDPPGHWAFQPDVDMTLAAFTQALRDQGRTVGHGGQWSGPTTWPGPNATEERNNLPAMGDSTTTPSPFSAKVHDFILEALDHHIASLRSELDSEDDDDRSSDLTNDLVLYQLIRRDLAQRGHGAG